MPDYSIKLFVKVHGTLSVPFMCKNGVRQGECISPFLFAMNIGDLEETLIIKGIKGVDIEMYKLFICRRHCISGR